MTASRIGWLVALLAAGCFRAPPEPRPTPPPIHPVRLPVTGIDRFYQLTPQLASGSVPEGDAGFRSLQKLGIRTVITVDGAVPDWQRAERFGLRYVHLPIGYDGIPRDSALRLVRAARDLPGPVYIHCHHGMHRGPAAAACVLLALEPAATPTDAADWLKLAETDPKYSGLITLPQTFQRPTRAELDATPATFSHAATVPDLTRMMVAVDARWEALTLARNAGWRTPADHPDIDLAHEAVQLVELYREAARLPESQAQGGDFVQRLQEAEQAAARLEQALRHPTPSPEAAFQLSRQHCSRCHARWRNHR